MLNTTWTNNQVALKQDLIFGLVVFSTEGWRPVSEADDATLDLIVRSVDRNASCPFLDDLDKEVASRKTQV